MKMVQFYKTGSDFCNTGGTQTVRSIIIGCVGGNWMLILYFSIVFIQLCLGTERLRFGYVDRMSDFVFTYEGSQNGFTVFPGKS